MKSDPSDLLLAFAEVVREVAQDPNGSDGDIVERFINGHSLDRDDLLVLARWCWAVGASGPSDSGPHLGPQIALAFLGAELSARAGSVPSPAAEDLKALFSTISFSEFLDDKGRPPVDHPVIAPAACVMQHFRLTRPQAFSETADAISSTLVLQGWTVTQRERDRAVQGNAVPAQFVPESLTATLDQDMLTVSVGWPIKEEAVVTLRRAWTWE